MSIADLKTWGEEIQEDVAEREFQEWQRQLAIRSAANDFARESKDMHGNMMNMKGTHEQKELTKALDPLQEALVTKMIDDRFRSLSKEIEKELKKLEAFSISTASVNSILLAIKAELMK